MTAKVTAEVIDRVVELIPDEWLGESGGNGGRVGGDVSGGDSGGAGVNGSGRAAYARYLNARLNGPRQFVEEAIRVRVR